MICKFSGYQTYWLICPDGSGPIMGSGLYTSYLNQCDADSKAYNLAIIDARNQRLNAPCGALPLPDAPFTPYVPPGFTGDINSGNGVLINIHFANSGQSLFKSGFAATGFVNADYWNALEVYYYTGIFRTGVALKYVNTGAAPVIISNFPNTSFTGFTGISPDAMLSTYIKGPATTFASISGLVSGFYDVYLYASQSTTATLFTQDIFNNFSSYGVKTIPGSASPLWSEGLQYVKYTNVLINNGVIDLYATNGLNGLQIFKTGEYIPYVPPIPGVPFSGNLINIDFGADPRNIKSGFAVTGKTALDFWNTGNTGSAHQSYFYSDHSPSIMNDLGGYTVVSTGFFEHPDLMYRGFLTTSGTITPARATVYTNFLPGTYDFYVYGHGPYNTGFSEIYIQVNSTILYNKYTASNSSAFQTGWVENAQYVKFPDIVLKPSDFIRIVFFDFINGMQILQKS